MYPQLMLWYLVIRAAGEHVFLLLLDLLFTQPTPEPHILFQNDILQK